MTTAKKAAAKDTAEQIETAVKAGTEAVDAVARPAPTRPRRATSSTSR